MEDDSLPLMFQTDMSDAPAELSLPKMLRELDLDVTCVPMNEARTRLYKILMKFIEDGDLDEDEWRTSDVRSIADYLGASAALMKRLDAVQFFKQALVHAVPGAQHVTWEDARARVVLNRGSARTDLWNYLRPVPFSSFAAPNVACAACAAFSEIATDVNRVHTEILAGVPMPADVGRMRFRSSISEIAQHVHPVVESVLRAQPHVVLAGGAALDATVENVVTHKHGDHDLFLWGVGPDEADAIVASILASLPPYDVMLLSDRALTIIIGNLRLQIVLRLYDTPAEILHSFDIPACKVLVRIVRGVEYEAWGTSSFVFCVTRQVAWMDPERYSIGYALRLCKYRLKGFRVVLVGVSPDRKRVDTEVFSRAMLPLCALANLLYIEKEVSSMDFRQNRKDVHDAYNKLMEVTSPMRRREFKVMYREPMPRCAIFHYSESLITDRIYELPAKMEWTTGCSTLDSDIDLLVLPDKYEEYRLNAMR